MGGSCAADFGEVAMADYLFCHGRLPISLFPKIPRPKDSEASGSGERKRRGCTLHVYWLSLGTVSIDETNNNTCTGTWPICRFDGAEIVFCSAGVLEALVRKLRKLRVSHRR